MVITIVAIRMLRIIIVRISTIASIWILSWILWKIVLGIPC